MKLAEKLFIIPINKIEILEESNKISCVKQAKLPY
jgi:hypothetical protein